MVDNIYYDNHLNLVYFFYEFHNNYTVQIVCISKNVLLYQIYLQIPTILYSLFALSSIFYTTLLSNYEIIYNELYYPNILIFHSLFQSVVWVTSFYTLIKII